MPKGKVRLDKQLVSSSLVTSRERARALILEGRVEVSGRRMDKPGTWIRPDESIKLIQPDHPYVSRGGVKLEGAVKAFGIMPKGKIAMDVGASTGGFTHCLLLNGALEVFAIDVGYGQFAWSLRQDPRVKLFERTNIRYLEREKIPKDIDLIAVDVSFISLKTVVPCLLPFMADKAEMVCLIKPQFEVGKGNVGKGGVVKDQEKILEILRDIEVFTGTQGLKARGIEESVLKGPKGNQEYFIHLTKTPQKQQ